MSFDFTCPNCNVIIDQLLMEKHSHNLEEVIIKCPKCEEALIPCEICNSFFTLSVIEVNEAFSDFEENVEHRFCENCGWFHLISPVSLRKYFAFSNHVYLLPFAVVQYIQRQIDQKLYIRRKRDKFKNLNIACASPRVGGNETDDVIERRRHNFVYLRKQLDLIEDLNLQSTLDHSYSFVRLFNSFTNSHFKMLQSLYSDERESIPFVLIKEFLSEKKSLANLKKRYHLHRLSRRGLDEIDSKQVRNDFQLKTIFTSQCVTRKEEWTKRTEKYKRLLCTLSRKVIVDLVKKMNIQSRMERGVSSGEDLDEVEQEKGESQEEEEEDDDFFLFGEEDNRSMIKKISLLNRYNLIRRLYGCVACVIF